MAKSRDLVYALSGKLSGVQIFSFNWTRAQIHILYKTRIAFPSQARNKAERTINCGKRQSIRAAQNRLTGL